MKSSATSRIEFKTIAVLDIETCNLPTKQNKFETSITELSIASFASSYLKRKHLKQEQPPSSPRMLQKLTLLFDPDMEMDTQSELLTGLYQDQLEQESKFDINAADTILGFLHHLPAPVCLVAHCGWGFDFPIVKQELATLQKTLPNEILCVDSLRAFLEIDKIREKSTSSLITFDADASPVMKKYPPRGVYKLESMYQRIFNQSPVIIHRAEADVEMLVQLLLHYGEDFVAYAEQFAKPFTNVPLLGTY